MSGQLRVLFIVPRFATVNRGVETFVLELISRMDTSRFAVTVLSGTHQTSVPGITFVSAPLLARERLAWLDRMPRLGRCLRPLGMGSGADIEALSLLMRHRAHWPRDAFDIVVPLGGTWSYRFARKAFPAARIVSIGQAGPVQQDLRRSDIFVALTPHDEARARQLRPGIATHVIPNGVDTERFLPQEATAPPSEGTSESVILCAAALVPDKRHDLLFDAVLRLPDNIRVRCVGTGPHRPVLEQHPLFKQGRVEFCQFSYAQMPDVYRAAHVFSLASPEEAFGIVFVEAMACGLPVVANNGPRQQFVVQTGGVLCDVRDAAKYAEALMSVLNAAPSREAREQALKFDWRNIAARYEELFVSMGAVRS